MRRWRARAGPAVAIAIGFIGACSEFESSPPPPAPPLAPSEAGTVDAGTTSALPPGTVFFDDFENVDLCGPRWRAVDGRLSRYTTPDGGMACELCKTRPDPAFFALIADNLGEGAAGATYVVDVTVVDRVPDDAGSETEARVGFGAGSADFLSGSTRLGPMTPVRLQQIGTLPDAGPLRVHFTFYGRDSDCVFVDDALFRRLSTP